MPISPTDTITRASKLAQRIFDERMLVVTARDSILHRFNEVGTFVWGLLEKPRTVSAICDEVAGHFDGVTPKEARRDITRFLNELIDKGLIEIRAP